MHNLNLKYKKNKKEVCSKTIRPIYIKSTFNRKIPVMLIGHNLITTKDFTTFFLQKETFTLRELQLIFASAVPPKIIYESVKKVNLECNSLQYAILLLKHLSVQPTAYENDNDKLSKDIVNGHIINLIGPCYMHGIGTWVLTEQHVNTIKVEIKKIVESRDYGLGRTKSDRHPPLLPRC